MSRRSPLVLHSQIKPCLPFCGVFGLQDFILYVTRCLSWRVSTCFEVHPPRQSSPAPGTCPPRASGPALGRACSPRTPASLSRWPALHLSSPGALDTSDGSMNRDEEGVSYPNLTTSSIKETWRSDAKTSFQLRELHSAYLCVPFSYRHDIGARDSLLIGRLDQRTTTAVLCFLI